MKRLISAALVLALCLSLLPGITLAADTVTVYCQTPESWETCHVHYWGTPSGDSSWPGVSMTKVEDGLWSADVPADAQGLLFNNGNGGAGNQTDILDIPAGNRVKYVVNMETWEELNAPVFRVVGNAEWMGHWNAASDAGLMEQVSEGVYQKCFKNVAPGRYEFKITKNGRWDGAWGDNGNNLCIDLLIESDITVTFTYRDGVGTAEVDYTQVLPGDVTGDDRLNVGDVAKLYAHVRGARKLTDELELACADYNSDGKINVGDIAKLYAYVRGTDSAAIVDAAYQLAQNEEMDKDVTLTGKVVRVVEPYDQKRGYVTVSIAVSSREKYPILCCRLVGRNVKKIGVNDIITVTGIIRNFYGTVEFAEGCQMMELIPGNVGIVVETDPARILAAGQQLNDHEELPYTVTLSGKILAINDVYSAQYENITVTISVDGTNCALKLYRLKGDGIEKLAVGDTLTAEGKLKKFYDELELVNGTMTNRVSGSNTPVVQIDYKKIVDEAYNLAEGAQLAYNATLEGKITALNSPYDAQYQNMTVTIVVEDREDKPIECYRMKGDEVGNHLCVGDTITVKGKIKNHNGTVEFDAGCVMTAREPGNTRMPSDPKQIVDAAFALGENASLPYFATLTGTVKSIDTAYSEQYRNVTVTMVAESSNGPKDIICYRLKGSNADLIAVGSTITVSGAIKRFVRDKDGIHEDQVLFDAGCILESLQW